MFALTHMYCAGKINPKADDLFLYGSVFPDIPVVGIIDWGLMKDKTPEFVELVSKNKFLSSFAKGITVHENPFGIDRFVHGDSGYAYTKGKVLHGQLSKYFSTEIIPIAAHSFIEYAVEIKIVEKFPDLVEKIKKIKEAADNSTREISEVFCKFFNLDEANAINSIKKYNQLLIYDISTKDKAIEVYLGILKELRSVDIPKSEVADLIDKSLIEVEDCFSFLDEVIKKCKEDYI